MSSNKAAGTYIRFGFATFLLAVTGFAVYLGWSTNQRMAKLYSPVPAAAYSPNVETYEFNADDFVVSIDTRTAAQLIDEYRNQIRAAISILKNQGNESEASRFEHELAKILTHEFQNRNANGTSQPRFHAVGLYEGSKNQNGDAEIHVSDTSGPITLAVCAYETVNWYITVAEGVDLQRIIASGYESQSIQEIPEGVHVGGHLQKARSGHQYRFYAHYSPAEWVEVSQQLKLLTGMELNTRQGAYKYEGSPFVIGPENPDWSAQMRAGLLRPLYHQAMAVNVAHREAELVNATFPMVHMVLNGRYGHDMSASFATASVFGPYTATLTPLATPVKELGFRPQGPNFFAISNDQIVTVDPNSGSTTELPGKPTGIRRNGVIAVDYDNNRIYVWERNLVAMELLTKSVDVIREGNPDVRGLAYCSEDNCLYAACAPHDGNSHDSVSELRKLNLKGADIEKIPLSVHIPTSSHGDTMQMEIVAGRVVLMPYMMRDGNGYLVPVDQNYVFDRHTGNSLFVCKRKPH